MALKDINEATREELTAVPQMGDARAETIIHHRERLGGFTSVQQMADEVPGISETMAEQIGAYFAFPEGQEDESAEGEDDESDSPQAQEDADDEQPVTSEDDAEADDDEAESEPLAEDKTEQNKQPRRATSKRKAPAKRSAG